MWVFRLRNGVAGLAVVAAVGILLTQGAAVQQGVKSGLALCADVVIPSLFVFLCLCFWAARSGIVFQWFSLFRWPFTLLMGKGWQGGLALVMGLLGGYPLGAAALRECYTKGTLTAGQVKRLALGVFFPSPAFACSVVGVGLFRSLWAGGILWVAASLPSLVFTCVLGWQQKESAVPLVTNAPPSEDGFTNGLGQACRTMITICALVVLGRTLLQLTQQLPLPDTLRPWLAGVVEVTNGCVETAPCSFSLTAAVMAFGGVSTHLQVRGILGELMPCYPVYLLIRLVQGAAAYGLSYLLCLQFPQVIPTGAGEGHSLVMASHSYLPSAAVVLTCFVFLGWLRCYDPYKPAH